MPEQPTSDAVPSAPDAPDASTASDASDASTTSDTSHPSSTPASTPDATPAAAAPVPPAPQSADAPKDSGSGSKRKKILSALGTVVVLLAVKFGLGYMLADKPAADTLSVGQCVQRGDDDTINAVDCKDSKAQYKVVFIAKDTKESQADQTCSPYEATTMTYFESGQGDETGNTICLGPVG